MKLSKFADEFNLEVIQNQYEDCEINDGYTSDLLSDVMANAPAESVLITIQAHKNTIAVAGLAGIRAVVVCNNRKIEEDMIKAAKEEEIAIFKTKENQFRTTHKISAAIL